MSNCEYLTVNKISFIPYLSVCLIDIMVRQRDNMSNSLNKDKMRDTSSTCTRYLCTGLLHFGIVIYNRHIQIHWKQ